MNRFLKNPREFLLFTLVVWVCALLALVHFLNRSSALWAESRAYRAEIAAHRESLQFRDAVQSELAQLLNNFDESQVLNRDRFLEGIDRISSSLGLEASFGSPTSHRGEFFEVHVLALEVRQVQLQSLIDFQSRLREELPSVGVRSVTLSVSRNDPRRLDASFELSTVEIRAADLQARGDLH